jgi:hypothetical protein
MFVNSCSDVGVSTSSFLTLYLFARLIDRITWLPLPRQSRRRHQHASQPHKHQCALMNGTRLGLAPGPARTILYRGRFRALALPTLGARAAVRRAQHSEADGTHPCETRSDRACDCVHVCRLRPARRQARNGASKANRACSARSRTACLRAYCAKQRHCALEPAVCLLDVGIFIT